jgi:hypothetical protein
MPATTVILPTEIFSLDRHESYAHERFAYDILRIAVPALRVAHMAVFDLDRELARLLVAVSTPLVIGGVLIWQLAAG